MASAVRSSLSSAGTVLAAADLSATRSAIAAGIARAPAAPNAASAKASGNRWPVLRVRMLFSSYRAGLPNQGELLGAGEIADRDACEVDPGAKAPSLVVPPVPGDRL